MMLFLDPAHPSDLWILVHRRADYDIFDTRIDGPPGRVYVYEVHYRKVPLKDSQPSTLRDRIDELYGLCATGYPPKQYNLHGSMFYFIKTLGSAASHYHDPRRIGSQSDLDHRMASTSTRLLSSQQNTASLESRQASNVEFPLDFYKPVVRDFALNSREAASPHQPSRTSSAHGHHGALPRPESNGQTRTSRILPQLSLSEYITARRYGRKLSEPWNANYEHAQYKLINENNGKSFLDPSKRHMLFVISITI
jgi:hypothetical protein